jgi:hypothetical protein
MIFRYLHPIYVMGGTYIRLIGEYRIYRVEYDFTSFWIDRDMMFKEVGRELSERIISLYYKCEKVIWYDNTIDRFINVPVNFISIIYGDVDSTPILIAKNTERYFRMYQGYIHVTKDKVKRLDDISSGYIELPEPLQRENISIFSYFYPIHIPVDACITRNRGHYIMTKSKSVLCINLEVILRSCCINYKYSEIPNHIDILDMKDPYTCDFSEYFIRVENIRDDECRLRKRGEHPRGRCTRDIDRKKVISFRYRGNTIIVYESINNEAVEIRYTPISIYTKYVPFFSDIVCIHQ